MMISDMKQHKQVDFRKVYRKANEILAVSPAISDFPFKVKEVVREQSDIVLCTFEKAKRYQLDIKHFGSESAVLIAMNGAYIIFYNQAQPKPRIRFSIMHEFGHYELGHKMNLSKEDLLYGIQEIEANCFAAQMLMPEQLLRVCSQRGKVISEEFIVQSFAVSSEAARRRKRTLAGTEYEWHSREEKDFDDIILRRYEAILEKIAPQPQENSYSFEEDYIREQERNSWMDSRSRWG